MPVFPLSEGHNGVPLKPKKGEKDAVYALLKKTHIQLVRIANPDQLLVTPINPILSIHLVAPSPKATFEKKHNLTNQKTNPIQKILALV